MANGLFNLKQVMQGIQQGGWNGQKPPAVEYLVVAGGGGGGGQMGGGGGAGGLLTGIDPVPNGQTLLVTVGGGGNYGLDQNTTGTNGSNSIFGQISALGGGVGASMVALDGVGGAGGSGGGGATQYAKGIGGQGTSGQGNAGANGSAYAGAGGGGGGAGTVGLVAITTTGGNGGAGIASVINGTVTAYAGGGGGGGPLRGYGGVGGGGNGGNGGTGADGSTNTGGGGGGGGSGGNRGGNGGSGIVIVSYPDVYAAAASTTGSPTVSTSGSGSISFNGSTQYLNYNGQSGFAFGTGDFTIEFFVYLDTLGSSDVVLYDSRPASTQGAYPLIYFNSTTLYYYTNSATAITGSSALSATTWLHIAVARSGTSTKMFVNGTQVGSTYSDSTNYLNGASRPAIATGGFSFGSNLMTGKISNLRVVKGTAVYTANFTAPTAPLTAITNTQLLLNAVSGAYLADSSTNSFVATATGTPTWNALSPFTVTGYKNRVYTWTSSGSITF